MRTKLRKGLFVVGLTIVASMALKEPSNVSANQEDAFEIVWNEASLKGDEGNYNWFVEGGTLKIQGTGEMGDFLDHTDNNPPWYDHRKEITQVEISEGITKIGRGAFYEFENLKEISIPDSVTIIADIAFSHSGLTKVIIPDNVVSIGEQAFYENANLTEIEFGENVESIGGRALSRTGLKTVKLPEKLTIVESGLFEMCEDLEQVIFNDGLKEIKDYAFYHTILQSADLPNTVESIGMNAFDSTKLHSLKTPQNLKIIDDNAFIACDNLSTVTLNEGLKDLGIYSFKFCPITEITLPTSLEECFEAFEGCDKLEKIYVSKSNPIFFSLDGVLFRYEGNQLEFYPLGKTNTSYNIPEGIEVLGYRCFEDANPYLEKITIPISVTSIKEGVFQFLPEDVDVYYEGTKEDWKGVNVANWGLGNGNISERIKFLNTEVVSGKCGDNLTWKLDKDGVLTISGSGDMYNWDIGDAPWASNGYYDIKEVEIEDGVTSIGSYAFYEQSVLTGIRIGGSSSLTAINTNAFAYSGISAMYIPENVSVVSQSAFMGCNKLKDIFIGKGLLQIEDMAFKDCDVLEYVHYNGLQHDWGNISIGNENEPLLNAKKIFLDSLEIDLRNSKDEENDNTIMYGIEVSVYNRTSDPVKNIECEIDIESTEESYTLLNENVAKISEINRNESKTITFFVELNKKYFEDNKNFPYSIFVKHNNQLIAR